MAECILMRKALSIAEARVQWPPDVQLQPWSTARAEAAYTLLIGARQLEAGISLAEWLDPLAADPEFDPRLCRLAYGPDGLVGFAMGWTSSFIRHLVVLPGARRQGLGLALLSDLFNAYRKRDEGFVDLTLWADNAEALRLYTRAGMDEVRRYTL